MLRPNIPILLRLCFCKPYHYLHCLLILSENQPTSNNGYVKPFLVTHVPGWGGPGPSSTPSYPNTPHMFQAPSPEAGSARDTPSVASHVSDSVSRSVDYDQFPQHFSQLWAYT